ncbi:MAG: FAD:protein FMN transferase [Candidatus Margulisiibacteriota bacterium]
MRRFLVLALINLLLVSALIFYLFTINAPSRSFEMMGTRVTITVKDQDPGPHIKAAYDRLKDLEEKLNRFAPLSEINRINNLAGIAAAPVSIDTLNCVELAVRAARETGGSFDPTLRDYRKIKLDRKNRKIKLLSDKLQLNLDGIAKGFAVEEARKVLRKRGVKSAMIDMHSSIAVIGGPSKIGIQHPRKKNELLDTLILKDGESLSTSGDYEQGRHILNPKTGLPATACQAVTVVTRNAGWADALSTGIFVLGPEKGLELAKKLNIKVLIVDAKGKIFRFKL